MFVSKGRTASFRKFNEDVYYISDDCVFVIDGATGLANNQVMSEDDAHWFAHQMKNEIIKNIDLDSLSDVVKTSLIAVQGAYKLDVAKVSIQDMPSATLSLFRIKNGYIEYFGVGDSVGIIELKNGNVETYYDEELEKIDQSVIDEMSKISKEKNISLLEARPYVNDKVYANRNLRNQENGYYALDLTLDCLKGATHKIWKQDQVNRSACMSDGFYQILAFKHWDEKTLLDTMEQGLEPLFDYLYNAQEMDKDCVVLPRMKIRDDTTAIISKVKDSKVKGVIFDMDGVIVDSSPFWIDLFKKMISDHGKEMTQTDIDLLSGCSDDMEIEILRRYIDGTVDEIRKIRKKYFNQNQIYYGDIGKEGIIELLHYLKRENIMMSIASSSPLSEVNKMIEQLHLEGIFDVKMTGEMVKETKPDPQIYLDTVKLMNMDKDEIIVIEDSVYGIESAQRAGLEVFVLKTPEFSFDENEFKLFDSHTHILSYLKNRI